LFSGHIIWSPIPYDVVRRKLVPLCLGGDTPMLAR
jgi:hypothetical protein